MDRWVAFVRMVTSQEILVGWLVGWLSVCLFFFLLDVCVFFGLLDRGFVIGVDGWNRDKWSDYLFD